MAMVGGIQSPQMTGIQAGAGRRKRRSPLVSMIEAQAAQGAGTKQVIADKARALEEKQRQQENKHRQQVHKHNQAILKQKEKQLEMDKKYRARQNEMDKWGTVIQGVGTAGNLLSKMGLMGGFSKGGGGLLGGIYNAVSALF